MTDSFSKLNRVIVAKQFVISFAVVYVQKPFSLSAARTDSSPMFIRYFGVIVKTEMNFQFQNFI